jgi:uncharacterized protein YbcI
VYRDAMNQADGTNTVERDRLHGGELNSAIATSAVRVYRAYAGRGPTKAQAFFARNVLVVLLEDTLTREERSLASAGGVGAVRELRRELQLSMREPLVDAVEELTGCKVVAFMGHNEIEPDLATAVFVLGGLVDAY